MSNTSATGGYLIPTSEPMAGATLRAFFHDFIVGITGLDATLVRPLWQINPPQPPSIETNWMAFGITQIPADIHPSIVMTTTGNGEYVRRQEEFDILCSFYGPDCDLYSSRLRDGLEVSQNLEVLYKNGLSFGKFIAPGLHVPEVIRDRWYDRLDFHMIIRREAIRKYQVLTFASANAILNTEVLPPIDIIVEQEGD